VAVEVDVAGVAAAGVAGGDVTTTTIS